jgi:hypothetical protein
MLKRLSHEMNIRIIGTFSVVVHALLVFTIFVTYLVVEKSKSHFILVLFEISYVF